jgi:integrase
VDAGGRPALAGAIRHGVRAHVSEPAVAAVELAALQSFLEFALDPAQRKGQLARTDLSAAAETLADVFRKRTPKHTVQPRKTPGGRLNEEELAQVRRLIGSPARRPGAENPFGERVAYRNWLLFEVSIATGFRVSELAALTVSSVPRGRDLMKLRDISGAAWDPRREEAGTKTFARNIPIPQWLIEHLWEYLDNPREPWGRSQKGRNQALWTAPDGKPLSVRQTSRVFHEIGRAAGFRVTAHRPRHRFVYEVLGRMDPQTARELTGHSSSQGLRPYAEERLGEQAQEKHRAGHEAIAAFLRSGHEAGHLEES